MLEKFQFIGKKLFEEKLVTSHGGNMSFRLGDKIIITKKDVMLSELKAEDLIEISMDGEIDANASLDAPIHRAIYANTSAQAIVHAHPAYAVAAAMNDEKILPQDLDGKSLLKSIPVIRVRDQNSTEEIIKFLIPAIKSGYPGCLVRGHGSYTIGSSLEEAYKLASILEFSCKIVLLSKVPVVHEQKREEHRKPQYRTAIPPSIGVMDRTFRDRPKR